MRDDEDPTMGPIHTIAARLRDLLTIVLPIFTVLGFLALWGSDSNRVKNYFRDIVGMADFESSQKESISALVRSQTALGEQIESFIKVQLEERTETIEFRRDQINTLGELSLRVDALENKAKDMTPAIQFVEEGSSISDGVLGGLVSMTYTFIKSRDCGRPMPDDFFLDANGVRFRFIDVSLLDNQGRGTATEPNTSLRQTIRYTARIPDDRGVSIGQAQGWVVVQNYENCPWLAPIISPRLEFEILPGDLKPR